MSQIIIENERATLLRISKVISLRKCFNFYVVQPHRRCRHQYFVVYGIRYVDVGQHNDMLLKYFPGNAMEHQAHAHTPSLPKVAFKVPVKALRHRPNLG